MPIDRLLKKIDPCPKHDGAAASSSNARLAMKFLISWLKRGVMRVLVCPNADAATGRSRVNARVFMGCVVNSTPREAQTSIRRKDKGGRPNSKGVIKSG